MITEDYVSFETALLLKEKGFNEVLAEIFHDAAGEIVRVPTLQMAMKWLRYIHGLHIEVDATYEYIPRKYVATIERTEKCDDITLCPPIDFSTYEEAAEIAIKYCLENLI